MRKTEIAIAWRKNWRWVQKKVDFEDGYKDLWWGPWGNKGYDCVHCYTEDRKIECIWRCPEKSVQIAAEKVCCIGPDYSIDKRWPFDLIRWQLYRSMQVCCYWQANGINCIPSYNWINGEQIEAMSAYYLRSNIIAVRSPTAEYEEAWLDGARAIIKIRKPSLVIQFGTLRGIYIWKNAVNIRLRKKKNKQG